jgi:hypothetical protein
VLQRRPSLRKHRQKHLLRRLKQQKLNSLIRYDITSSFPFAGVLVMFRFSTGLLRLS